MNENAGVSPILGTANTCRDPPMKCSVVRSSLKEYTYIYLRDGYEFDDLPDALRQVFGTPEPVMNLELTADRKLAYEDVEQVMHNLSEQGYHLQLPPKEDASGWLDLPGTREAP